MEKRLCGNAALFVLGLVLGAALAIPGCASGTGRTGNAQPVAETTAVWGSFDEVRLFRYFDADDMAVGRRIPERAAYGGRSYVLAGTDGPFETEWGLCVEAMYAEERE